MRRWTIATVPALLILGAGVFAAWSLLADDDDAPEPVAITAAGPRFGSVDEMASAADAIVIATVASTDDGRTITAPDDPDAGIVTRLVELDVLTTLRGPDRDFVIVEEEATLLDGTPVVVNGLEPAPHGATAIWFLVEGDGDQFPYTALVNEQGRIPIVDGRTANSELVAPGIPLEEIGDRLTKSP